MEKDREIDNLFKKGLHDPVNQPAFREGDWDAMEQLLDKKKQRPVSMYWLPVLGSVAALLLLFIGWWLFRPVIAPGHNTQMAANHKKVQQDGADHQQKNSGKSGGAMQQLAITKQAPPANILKQINTNNAVNTVGLVPKLKPFFSSPTVNGRLTADTIDNKNAKQTAVSPLIANVSQSAVVPTQLNAPAVKSGNITDTIDNKKIAANTVAQSSVKKVKAKPSFGPRPQFAISAYGATDLNGVNSLQQSKVGTNGGLLFSVKFNKLKITSGAIYSAKPYETDFANYHTAYRFPTNPVTVTANCKMFDIPLNIDYQVYSHHQNKFSIGTGISSYLMLHEAYDYNYAVPGTAGPTYYNVPKPDKYLFSILNLQATYERQVNSKVGISIQPYMKLPLSAVGVSQVRLQTTGVAVGLSWNLNSTSKP